MTKTEAQSKKPKDAPKKDSKQKKEKPAVKKEKKEKDPNAPKRPLSGYLIWTMEHRDELKKKHPELKGKQIMSALGEEWNKLPESVKKTYNDQSSKAREVYVKDKEKAMAKKEKSEKKKENLKEDDKKSKKSKKC